MNRSHANTDPKILTDVPQVIDQRTPIVLDGLNCREGRERRLDTCERAQTVEYCSHSNDAGANCTIITGINTNR